MSMSKSLKIERLRQMLSYNSDTGILTWAKSPRYGIEVGSKAGCYRKKDGYECVRLDGKLYLVHRLVWFWVHGEWPVHELDHVNGERTDNRIANLRLATRRQNSGNTRAHRDSEVPLKGVSVCRKSGRYRARLNNKTIGYFSTPEEAHRAYVAAAEAHFGEFARAA